MSRLDAIVNKMLHLTATSWSQSSYQYAMLNRTVYEQQIIMTTYPHLYVIRIDWTPTTYIGLVLSLLITLNMYLLAARWANATYRLGFDAETWNLLEPVDLMAYSLAAYDDLVHSLNTIEHRQKAMRGKTPSILRERPVWEGTQSLIGLVNTLQSPVSAQSNDSPIDAPDEKADHPDSPALAKDPMNVTIASRDGHTTPPAATDTPAADPRADGEASAGQQASQAVEMRDNTLGRRD